MGEAGLAVEMAPMTVDRAKEINKILVLSFYALTDNEHMLGDNAPPVKDLLKRLKELSLYEMLEASKIMEGQKAIFKEENSVTTYRIPVKCSDEAIAALYVFSHNDPYGHSGEPNIILHRGRIVLAMALADED